MNPQPSIPVAYTPIRSLNAILGTAAIVDIVDVGANPVDGETPYSRLLSRGHARVVGFEPNPDALAKLQAAKGPNETYLPHAVGDGGRHTLRLCALPGMSSLLEPNLAVLSLFYGFAEWARVVERVELDTVRLDDVPEVTALDLLKIDIQGAELMVFRNAPRKLAGTLVIHAEVEFLPMYVGQPLFSEVEAHLRGFGFVPHRFQPLVTRDVFPLLLSQDPYAGHSQMLWADVVFVRDFTRLDLLTPEQLLKMALIVHDCYGSPDLVLHLLKEHDRRAGTGHAKHFLMAVLGRS